MDETEPIVFDRRSMQTFVFVENQKMLDIVNSEDIGFLEGPGYRTKAPESLVEGEGLKEGTVGRKAQFNLITRNAERKQGYNKQDRVTVEIKDEQEREYVTEIRIDDRKDWTYIVIYYPRKQGTLKIFVKVNGEDIRGSPCTVTIKPFHVKPVLSFGKGGSGDGMLSFPYGIAVTDKDEIVVTDHINRRVQVFDSNGTFLKSFGLEGQNAVELNTPTCTGIAIDKDRNIFVAEYGSHRVQIFSWEGRHLGSFGGRGTLDSQLHEPRGLSLDSTGNVIVADSGNKLIKIFTTYGRFVMKIGGEGSFCYPIHCVQCGEYFIASDWDEDCIKVFNREGHFQYKFGNNGVIDGEFSCPWFLSVTQSKHLLVCDKENHRIQVFELDGKFVGKFGTNGSELGELNDPISVAVLSNDQIVVCNRQHNRIQIFE